ncbi:MAG: glutamyl-tRNA reductase [Candidatus Limnocylindrales bacterium]
MSAEGSVAIAALLTHARDVAVAERETFARRVRDELAGRALVLETCHRVEAYLAIGDDADVRSLAAVLPPGGRLHVGEDAVRHAMTVAVGRDSVVLGEDQILHQLRASVEATRAAVALNPALDRLFALALRAGRRARSWRQGPNRSLADVAVAAIEQARGPIRGQAILVVGAGRMGRLAAHAAVSAGASVAIANRSHGAAADLARAIGGRPEAFDPGVSIGSYAGLIVAIGGPWAIGPSTIAGLARGTAVVVDLSVPPAIPMSVATVLGRRLVTADAVARDESPPPLQTPASTAVVDRIAARAEELVTRTTAEFIEWQNGRAARAAAAALVQRADRARETELADLWRRLPDLDAATRDAIEGMTRHLAGRLLREPLERLGRDSDGRDERAVRDIFAL